MITKLRSGAAIRSPFALMISLARRPRLPVVVKRVEASLPTVAEVPVSDRLSLEQRSAAAQERFDALTGGPAQPDDFAARTRGFIGGGSCDEKRYDDSCPEVEVSELISQMRRRLSRL